MAIQDKIIRELCRRLSPHTERLGFVLSPIHFYFPIPFTRDLEQRKVWNRRSSLAGIDWNAEGQKRFVREELGPFATECLWEDPDGYRPDAPTFGYTSAMFAHCVTRWAQPRRIMEVGAGWSTLVFRRAAAMNSQSLRQSAVDPYPPEWLAGKAPGVKIIAKPVQQIPPRAFENLQANDILFIDSSHVINPGSDVNYLYLEILPRLKPGVLVHIHDIQLPWEYPRDYAIRQRWFWNEQYLLQALLQGSREFEILAAGHWLAREESALLESVFPLYTAERYGATGSFWMRRR